MVNIPKVGRVWHRFEQPIGRTMFRRKFAVMEVTDIIQDEVLKFLERNYFSRNDPISKAALETNINVKSDYRDYWENEILPQNLSVVCFEDNTYGSMDVTKMVGVHLFEKVKTGQNKMESFSSSLPETVMKINEMVHSKFDPYKTYRVDEYLNAVGVVLLEPYELNIAEHMLRASDDICKSYNLKLCTVYSTSPMYHTAAQKAGFRSLMLIEKDEIEQKINHKFSENLHYLRISTRFIR